MTSPGAAEDITLVSKDQVVHQMSNTSTRMREIIS